MANVKYTAELLAPIVAASSSYTQVAKALGVFNATTQTYISKRIKTLGLASRAARRGACSALVNAKQVNVTIQQRLTGRRMQSL